jgi:predicted acyltransferase
MATPRLVSLDAFRGATIALMILVNTPGDGHHVYWPLEHAQWNGWTPTDVVFPTFLWIVGLAMTLSSNRTFAHVVRRSAILFVLGVLLYVYPRLDLSTTRILGVLQRIAICYFITAAILRTTKLRGQIAWMVSLLAAYWLLMSFAPVPGFGAGRLDVEGNFAHYIDLIVLGAHNYRPTKTWDPEGIVSTLPAIVTCLLGVIAGQILRLQRTLGERCMRLAGLGAVLLVAGLICNIWMPINKKLWTDSFVLFMAGLDFLLFSGFLWLVDGRGWKRAVHPFVIMGSNAIAIYVASEAIEELLTATSLRAWIYRHCFAAVASSYNASLLYAIVYTLMLYLLAWVMYRRGWFVRA